MTVQEQVKKLYDIVELNKHLEEELKLLIGVGTSYFPARVAIGANFKLLHSATSVKVALQAQRIITEQLEIINATLQELDNPQVNIVDILETYDRLISEVN